MNHLKLGLIGVGIARSQAPRLHRLAGRICGVEVSYALIALPSASPSLFDDSLSECGARGYDGVNVTHPFKERAAESVAVASEQIRRLGAINTVRFDAVDPPQGYNSDYTGFKRMFAARFPGQAPGIVAIVGAGGVGRAIAFGLSDLGADEIRLHDRDTAKAERLAAALRAGTKTVIRACADLAETLDRVDGLINATPVGMHGHPGTAIPSTLLDTRSWAFDAVYTPVDTEFLTDAAAAGLETLSGYELFFYQGVDAFEIFSGLDVDETSLRRALALPDDGPGI